jgi:hypothetical protein
MIPLALAFLWAGAVDPAAVLTRVLAKVRQELWRMPNYTCLQTITRDFFVPKAPVRRECEVTLRMKQQPTLDMQLRRSHTDRLRLEVAISRSGEMHAWPGASGFEDRPIDEVVREGPVGTGMFGALLSAVCAQDVRRFVFVKEMVVNGEDRLEYSFSVPKEDSHYRVRVWNSWEPTAYSGTIEVDPAAEEVRHMRVETAMLPPASGSCQSTADVDLAITSIGSGRFPLATVARQRFVAGTGEETVNTIGFSECREYRGESTVRYFETADRSSGTQAARAVPPIPAGLRFTTQLEREIDAATAAAGDAFEARLREPLKDARGRTLAPKGAKVEGRLLRVQVFHRGVEELVVVLRPESVETREGRAPLAASRVLPKVKGTILLPFEWETNAALLRFTGIGATAPKGFVTEWRTMAR